jgi:hypothetical protein
MPDDDVIPAHEDELTAEPARRSNRGFWLVAGALLIACVFLVVEIFANEPLKDTIAHAESTLRDAQAAAERVHDGSGSYADADVTNTYRGSDEASAGLDDVSVATPSGQWAAAVQARPGACFYLRLTDDGQVFYGVGTVCTGQAALGATDPRW